MKSVVIIVMGVSGSGKTSHGRALAAALGWAFADADDFHPPANVAKMAAGIPLDPSFAEQKQIMLRCKGVFYGCKDGAEARRLNRLLIEAGMIRGL